MTRKWGAKKPERNDLGAKLMNRLPYESTYWVAQSTSLARSITEQGSYFDARGRLTLHKDCF